MRYMVSLTDLEQVYPAVVWEVSSANMGAEPGFHVRVNDDHLSPSWKEAADASRLQQTGRILQASERRTRFPQGLAHACTPLQRAFRHRGLVILEKYCKP